MTDIISDEKLAEIRLDAESCYRIDRGFEAEAFDILSLLARLDKAEALVAGIREDQETFRALQAAYIRGAKWSLEMGMHYKPPALYKAAYDYADKATSPVSSGRKLADAHNNTPHVP